MTPRKFNRRELLKGCGLGMLALRYPALARASEPTKTTVLEDMGKWVAALRYDEMPPEIVAKAKRVLLDTVGCALGAAEAGPVRIAQQVVSLRGGKPQATPLGVNWKTSCDEAAFLTGMAIRYLDYNDYAALGSPHHCSINLAPALAVAEMQGLTGKDLLLGIVTGYEVQLRLRDATEGPSGLRGWDTGTMATAYSSAAVAAKLLGLDASRIAYAVAIAGAHGNTLAEVRGAALSSGGVMTPSKGTADPMSARLGTFSALLARGGLTYPLTVLEGTAGYGKIVSKKLEEKILRERSGDFQIAKSCFKMWPCFVYGQAPIAAALEIYRKKVVPEEIQSITIGLSDVAYRNQQDYRGEITAREHADHSVPYVVVRALLDGAVKVDDFDERRFKEPRAVDLYKKASLRSDPSLSSPGREGYGVQIEVQLRSGTVLRAELPAPPGSMQNPADDAGVTKKFLTLSENILGKQRAQKAAEVILSVEKITDLRTLLSAISPAKSA